MVFPRPTASKSGMWDRSAGTVVDSQFADPLPYWLYIAGMPEAQPIETRGDQGSCPFILGSQSPFSESLGLLKFDHQGRSVV